MAYLQNWDNHVFYESIRDAKIQADIDNLHNNIAALAQTAQSYTNYLNAEQLPNWDDTIAANLKNYFAAVDEISPLLHNLHVFVNSVATIDSDDIDAKKLTSIMQALSAKFGQAMAPVMVFLVRVDATFINALYAHDFIDAYKFKIDYGRQHADQLLPVEQENLITALAQNGLQTWGNLYNELSGSLTGMIDDKPYGLAKIANMTSDANRNLRQQASTAINQAWAERSETSAAILNAINGWREEVRQKRSTISEYHFLDEAVRSAKISRKTLNAMMSAVYKRRNIGQRALITMQKHLKIDEMKPWDQSAPAPVKTAATYSFDEAIDLIADCFAQFNPEMGEFVKMMAQKGWIDAKPTETRRTGAYCTGFSEPREPRVFMTFEGSMSNVTTLAHELGHAWHHWVMRDMHQAATSYPMTLAETASIFAENLVRDYLFSNAKTDDDKLTLAWNDATSASSLLVNVAARFEFEKNFVKARQKGFIPAQQLDELMNDAWAKWYENSLSEYVPNFWATKLHFSIAGLSFYNYPYIFGYLFSLGVYQLKDQLGEKFNDMYTGLLRDTGSMTAEQVVKKHLGKDIESEDFWNNSLDMVDKMITDFESLPVK